MSYRTIIVGTDGSASSLRAVDRAGALAAQVNAKLIIASAHLDTAAAGRGGQRGLARRRQLGFGHGRRPSIGLGARHRRPQSQSRHPHRPHRRIASSGSRFLA
jgi:Universal stress protein family